MKLGILPENYKEHPRYAECTAKGGVSYEDFVEWITRPKQEGPSPWHVTQADYVRVRIPRADWNQIVDDIETMCGVGQNEIEILQNAEVEDE